MRDPEEIKREIKALEAKLKDPVVLELPTGLKYTDPIDVSGRAWRALTIQDELREAVAYIQYDSEYIPDALPKLFVYIPEMAELLLSFGAGNEVSADRLRMLCNRIRHKLAVNEGE
jgi:hypothetical protein